jgi:hypothetical protein
MEEASEPFTTRKSAERYADRIYRSASGEFDGRVVVRQLRKNPPMYAHHLRERKTHGMNLKQMRRLYAMVSRGNKKAITFARNVLGIPFDETPSQVKAVVKHHVLDLAERKVRKNPRRKKFRLSEDERWYLLKQTRDPYVRQFKMRRRK